MICCNCVFRPSLKKYISNHGQLTGCDFCQSHSLCVEDKNLTAFMLKKACEVLVPADCLTMREHCLIFDCGSAEPRVFGLWDFFEDFSKWAVPGFMDIFSENVPKETSPSGRTGLYALDDGYLAESNIFENSWEKFLFSINNKNRFFNHYATKFFDELFAVLGVDSALDGSVVDSLRSEQPIYRARLATNTKTIQEIINDPVRQLGPPPAHLASNQRMSPEGISVYYGAFDRATCISEIRPLVGDWVVSGEFRALTDLKLLDINSLAKFKPNLDVFDENYRQHAHATAFFKELVFQMARPARRGMSNAYLATQVIFEYLSIKFEKQIDGIKYSSVQQDQSGACIALFPTDTRICSASSNEPGLSVNALQENPDNKLFFVPDSLRYHRVRGVTYQQQEFDDPFKAFVDDKTLKSMQRFSDRF